MSALSRGVLAAVALACCGLTANFAHAQQDAKGCTDSPYLSRFPGTIINSCEAKDDDTADFIMGVGKANKKVEGKKYAVAYLMAPNATNVQVARNLNTALRQANWTNDFGADGTQSTWHKKDAWIGISVGGGYIQITSITLTTLTQDVVATAGELTKGIDSTGHAVVPGILFDTAKADVKDESKPALDEVAKLLTQNPKLRLWVVGHTDSVGAVASNVDLSKRRAAAVIAVLVAKYHIAAGRLDSFGNGPYAPVASNDTDAGRTQNRRVEIVKQ
jgi:outer membrane protein OmpA-like peptidoglycan-associated protein